jgi:hypothetical protein
VSVAATLPADPAIAVNPDRGRVSARLLRRTCAIYAGVCAAGLLPTLLGASPSWQAFGWGLWLPGGAFLAAGGWALLAFLASVAVFCLGVMLWFVMGNLIAVPIAWLGAAIVGALTVHGPLNPSVVSLIPILTAALIGWRALATLQRRRIEHATRERRNAYLPLALAGTAARAVMAPSVAARELEPDMLAGLRYVYDRALQPIDEFQGFDVIDQFRESAIRYQLNYMGYALAMAQCHYVPNFRGYLQQAQRNIIEKFLDRRVWSYWRIENALGNLRFNADPIGRDNIMLGGFFNANLALYAAGTGDMRYAVPGALTFRLDDRTVFEHDAGSVTAAARSNYAASPFCLYPCEPSFAFSYCNLLALTGIQVNDRVFATAYAKSVVPEFRRHFENEFFDDDGSIIAGRVTRTGMRFHFFDATFTRAAYCYLAHPHFPDIAERTWAMLREERVRFDAVGELDLELSFMDNLDIGNYRRTNGGMYVELLLAGREHGDDEVADAALRGLDRLHGRLHADGSLRYKGLSNFNNAHVVMGRMMRRHDWRRLVLEGPPPEALRGPVLAEAPFPDVQVARARSDGDDLDLVIYPGETAPQGPVRLRIEQLRPRTGYNVMGAGQRKLTADDLGAATLAIALDGRTSLRLTPVH